MLLKYFYDPEMAHASYMVGCQKTGEAIIIDPARHIEPYLQAAAANDMRLVAAAETHIHADFVSGAHELAAHSGARLILSAEGDEDWKYRYPADIPQLLVTDGRHFMIGNVQFNVLHTPGHTPESISFILTDKGAGVDRPMGIFTGDFVFVGSVGRPDLLEKAAGLAGTALTGAKQMFSSLQRFKELPDYLQLWPAHGAGSVCGKGLGAIPSSTVGYEKRFNPALAYQDEASFISYLLADQPEPPQYFAIMKRVNKEGPALLQQLPLPALLTASQIPGLLQTGNMVIDTRSIASFASGHIPGTINIPLHLLAAWAGWMVDYDKPLFLIVDSEAEAEAFHDLTTIGIDHVAGYFETAVIETYAQSGKSLQTYEFVPPAQLFEQIQQGSVKLIDVRNQAEWAEGHIPGAQHLMLGYLWERADELINDQPLVVHCQSGVRSAIAASILQAKGAKQVVNMQGGFANWTAAGLPIDTFCLTDDEFIHRNLGKS